jgi:RNA polymerase sigma factor (sigma-70 family)
MRRRKMRVLVLAKEGQQTEAAIPPTAEAMAEHQKFNGELVKAGVVVGSGRLSPSSQGKRVQFDGKKRTVIDGPFAESKELWPDTGCGRFARSMRPSSGSSGHPTTAGPSRSARFPSTRGREGALAIDPRRGGAPEDPGRREAAAREAHRAIEAIWRIESARLIAGLARLVGDIGTAEELAQDALVAALEQWPTSGVPERPGPWLMATAKHCATDLIRRRATLERKYEELGRDVERDQEGKDLGMAIDEDFGDDLLGLIFMACHPALSKEARVALTLRVLGGLTTEEIARGFLIPVPSLAQRLVRAKRTLAEAQLGSRSRSGLTALCASLRSLRSSI